MKMMKTKMELKRSKDQCSNFPMELSMKVNGIQSLKIGMEEDIKFGVMALFMKDIGKMTKQMAEVG